MTQTIVPPSASDTDHGSTRVTTSTAEHRPAPPSGSGWLGWLFSLAMIASGFGAGWYVATTQGNHEHKDVLPAEVSDSSTSRGVVVTTEPVSVRTVQRSVEAFGSLYGFEEVSISARVEGRIRRVLHDVADNVKPTEPLLEIDPTDYELSTQQADRALKVELAKLGLKAPPSSEFDIEKVPIVAKAKSQMDHAKARLERISRLAAAKTISAEESETAANDYRTMRAEYENQILLAETDLATIQMKQVGLDVAREQLANTRVVVPTPSVKVPGIEDVSYVVSQRLVSEGTVVRPGTEIFRIVINQLLKLRVPVPERYGSEIRVGQKADVHVATSSTPFSGTVTRVYPTVDSATRTFQVEIQVPNPKGELKPGSFAKAAILTRIDSDAVTVPLSAVIQFAGITKIFLADNGHAREVPVTLGTQTTEWVEIVEPRLTGDALVITSGQSVIANQTPITIRPLTENIDSNEPRPK